MRHDRATQPRHSGYPDRVVDGLKGFPEAITAVFPETVVQTCIVHLIRYSMQFASWKERKVIAAALSGHCLATELGTGHALFAFAPEVRKIIYTTNAIESLHSQVRKAVRSRGHFPSDEAATKARARNFNRPFSSSGTVLLGS